MLLFQISFSIDFYKFFPFNSIYVRILIRYIIVFNCWERRVIKANHQDNISKMF